LPHAEGEIAIRGFDEEVIVVVHEAESVAKPVVAFIDVGENPKKGLSVLVVFKNGFLFVPAGSDMIYGAGIFYAKGAGHEENLADVWIKVKQYRPDPKMFTAEDNEKARRETFVSRHKIAFFA
jgi:hypothetical protein